MYLRGFACVLTHPLPLSWKRGECILGFIVLILHSDLSVASWLFVRISTSLTNMSNSLQMIVLLPVVRGGVVATTLRQRMD